jgi:hypothetical protein
MPWATNEEGGDSFVLKFDRDGNFKMRIGELQRRRTATIHTEESTARRCYFKTG